MIIWDGLINVFLPNSELYWFCFVCFQMMENQIKLRFFLQFPSLNLIISDVIWNEMTEGLVRWLYKPKQCTYTVHKYTWQSWIGWAKTNESKREVWTEEKKKKQKTLGRISHNGTRFDHDNMCFTSADKTTIFSYSKESSIFLIFSSHN